MVDRRRIYLLSQRELPPETIAVTFAKTSRSPHSFSEIAAELSEAQAAQFHERWVVGYGHSSVAEHAVLHIAFENISRLAIECLESNRLASYTEKSTRYQIWTPDGYYTPPIIAASRHASLYEETSTRLFAVYQRSLEPVRRVMQRRYPRREEDESEEQWDSRIRARYVDNCRFILPAAALANVGMTANARVLEGAIRKMLSHPLEEVREIGAALKSVSQAEVPTLVKYADAVAYQAETAVVLSEAAAVLMSAPPAPPAAGAELVDYDPLAEDKFLAACLYRYGGWSLAECRAQVARLSAEQRAELAHAALGKCQLHDVPLRELEHVTYTFDVVLDQGGYCELKRHRMMTQSPQRLTCRLGYAVPRAFEAAGFLGEYEAAMQAAADAYEKLAVDFPEEASYLVPNAFNRRVLLTLNLREAFHFCELRSGPTAHFSMRRLAGQIHSAIARVHPLLAGYMRCRDNSPWEAVEAEFFLRVA